ncbi:hypothetical protein BS47DRAFT_739373 [Hydnum rufescens UP504]|uniref:Large ribosomal subunit protein eL42 n=1 Tax=Hydnum rufescens UP504 TaxID=1448309 RepID=A0A9P6DYH5_9AGAM|nr:hypothetical protein BS47DRAFT_739373 [Hydnum rufescens UP504]
MVNIPKTRRTYCKGKDCKKHTPHKVTQYKTGKAPSLHRESAGTTENNPGMVVRPSPSSTRRRRRRRRSYCG